MKIGEAAKETGLSVSNIRFYEKKGLLTPRRRGESQYREYGREDVRRLKEIMLLRKLGLPVESIYLMYEGQARLDSLIQRQQQELQEQMQQLEGALELCHCLLGEQDIEAVDVDAWLNYVREEEQKGKRFAQAEDFLEDLAEFSKMASFRYDPYVGRFFQNRWAARTLAVLLTLCLLFSAASVILSRSLERGAVFLSAAVWFWLIFLLCLGLNFRHFRRGKRKEREEEQ